MGEIEAAMTNMLPQLFGYQDQEGDLQVHSNWTDGVNSIKDMADATKEIGLKYIAISDHAKSLAMTGGLDEKMLVKQGEEIDRLNEELSGITILKWVELNILKDGRVDISDNIIAELEVVGAAIHSYFNLSEDEMTLRVLMVLENPNVDILYHPTTRQIQKREAILLDIERVIEAAHNNTKILDVDSYPNRLDLKDEYIRKAVERGVKLSISSDAHTTRHLRFLELGIAQARRGWATADDVINTWKLEEVLNFIN